MKKILILLILLSMVCLLPASRAIGYDVSDAVTVNTLQMPADLEAEVIDGSISLTWTGVDGTRTARLSESQMTSELRAILPGIQVDPYSVKRAERRGDENQREVISPARREILSRHRNHEFLGYNVYRNEEVINDIPVEETTYLDDDTVPGVTYQYFVTAVYDVAESFATNTVTADVAGVVYGDINRDGVVTPLDAAIILQYYVGYDPIPEIDPIPWTDESLQIADVDLDGQVLPLDAAIILQYYVGLIDSLPLQPDRNTSGSMATVEVIYEPGYLNIYSDSNVIGLGIEVLPEYSIHLGKPVYSSSDWLTAQHTEESTYRLALARAEATGRSNLILSIPVLTENIGQIELFLDINNQKTTRVVINTLDTETELLPTVTALKGNFPNPFNPETTIEFSLKEAGFVTIEIYNIRGQRVITLVDETKKAGHHSVIWNGHDRSGRLSPSGVYFTRMTTEDNQIIRKMLMMK